ncbi:DNA primase [Raineya orbicola]|uniref:DNA primase n=1 Tax=Raineya orbicola TaxID=2016530 RepID=A0A2N3I9N1_9BACT|nr:DNA primase [Raineya orbicola]PKQ67074.1 dnaG: DNA primase [Raineya orbicola]
MHIPREVVDKIYQNIDILEVVSDYVSLQKSGKDYKACCPFHNERTPSFFVTPAKGIFKCFGCGKGGDAVTFVMEIEGISYGEALRQLAQKYKIEIPENASQKPSDDELQKQNEVDALYIAMQFAKNFYQEQLLYTEEGKTIGLSYLKERGFNELTIKTFELGYATSDWDTFYRTAIKKGYNPTILEKAGLIQKKEGKNEYYDRFRERVMFPIHNVSGKVIAFGARTLKKDKDTPKYLNSPETPLYHKSKVLYGLFQAKKSILQKDECLLVEGYADVVALHQAGITNVVASSGTSLTQEQTRLIRRFTTNVIVLYDGDEAGLNAAMRGVDIILEEGLSLKVVWLPQNEDPDSFVQKHGTNAMLAYIQENAQDFIKFKTKYLLKNAENDPFRRGEAIREVVSSIIKIPDVIQRNVFFKECSQLFGIEEEILIREGNKILGKELKQKTNNEALSDLLQNDTDAFLEQKATEFSSVYHQEHETMRLLLCYADYPISQDVVFGQYLLKELQGLQFETPVFQEIFEIFARNLHEGRLLSHHDFMKMESREIRQAVINLISEKYELSPNWEAKAGIIVEKKDEKLNQVAYEAIMRMKWKAVQRMMKENQKNLQQASTEEEQDRFLQIHIQLKSIEQEIAKTLGNVVR